MSDNYSQNKYNFISKKGFFALILNQLFHGEPKNRDDFLRLIRGLEQNNFINLDTRNMLEGVMNISKQKVRDIMIPRSQIFMLNKNQSLQECLDIIIESTHSRFPVISEDKDHVEGILFAKDLLPFIFNHSKSFDIKKILKPVVVVPESKRVDLMLKEFRSQRYYIAVVIDEFGSVSGLVTIKDILELIVGEIEGEYDNEEQNIRQLNRYTFAIRALTPIESFNEFFNTKFSDKEVDTIGGLVMQAFGHLPKRGETININDYIFKVVIADSRRIIRVHVKIPKNLMKPIVEE